MRALVACVVAVVLGASSTSAEDEALSQKDVDAFYAMCWRELGSSPPKLEEPDSKSLSQQLKGVYHYEYRDAISGDTVKGSITLRYPVWDWPSEGSKGSARQFGDKIVMLGNDKAEHMRAFLLRINGDWHIMQMDFPGGLVRLKRAEPDGPAKGSQPIRSETNPMSSAAGSRRGPDGSAMEHDRFLAV